MHQRQLLLVLRMSHWQLRKPQRKQQLRRRLVYLLEHLRQTP